jgi:hypothetical protein
VVGSADISILPTQLAVQVKAKTPSCMYLDQGGKVHVVWREEGEKRRQRRKRQIGQDVNGGGHAASESRGEGIWS